MTDDHTPGQSARDHSPDPKVLQQTLKRMLRTVTDRIAIDLVAERAGGRSSAPKRPKRTPNPAPNQKDQL